MSCALKNLTELGLNTKRKFYVIAEVGINHGGDLDVAKRMIDSAAHAGVDAVKFQTYLTEKRVSLNSPIFGILKKCELPFKDFKILKIHAKNCGIEFFSTPFDIESVDYLSDIGCNIFKIASFDTVNMPLLRKIAKVRATVLMSVGMTCLSEIKKAYAILREETKKIALLHCVSAYPLKEADAHLSSIFTLKDIFDCPVGYSDHTPDITVPLFAAAAGAQIIEKHYMINNSMKCVDKSVSVTQVQTQELVKRLRFLEQCMGEPNLAMREAEKSCAQYRRHKR